MPDVAKCPFCLEWVRSTGNLRDARVECPVCGAQFAAEDLLPLLPPEVRVVPVAPTVEPTRQEPEAGHFHEPSESPHPTIQPATIQPETSVPIARPVDIDGFLPTAQIVEPMDASNGGRIPSPFVVPQETPAQSVTQRWQARRRGGKPAIELVKVVLGGLAGILIAQIILWWLPGNLRRDPFGIAPMLPPWLQWLQPGDFVSASPPARLNADTGTETTPLDPFPDDQLVAPLLAQDPTDLPTDQPLADDYAAIRAATHTATDGSPRQHDPTIVGLQDPPVYLGYELRQALAELEPTLQAVQDDPGLDRAVRRERLRIVYRKLCDVAQIISFLDSTDPESDLQRTAVDTISAQIAEEPKLRRLIAEAADSWLNFPSRTSDGIALMGEVQQIRPIGGMFETEVRLAARTGTRIRVLSATDPAQDSRHPYAEGDTLLLLGSIISAPSWAR